MRQNFDFDVDMTHLRYANFKTMFDGCKISVFKVIMKLILIKVRKKNS